MNRTPLSALLTTLDPESVLHTFTVPGEAHAYSVRGGEIYHHMLSDTGHGFMLPHFSDKAAWARVAGVCAFTVPANPQCMSLGAAGQRLGDFWRGLASANAERRVSASQLISTALPSLALAQ